MAGGQFGRTGLVSSCEEGERDDGETLAKSEEVEIFRSPDVGIPLYYSVKSKHFSTLHCTTNFKLPAWEF